MWTSGVHSLHWARLAKVGSSTRGELILDFIGDVKTAGVLAHGLSGRNWRRSPETAIPGSGQWSFDGFDCGDLTGPFVGAELEFNDIADLLPHQELGHWRGKSHHVGQEIKFVFYRADEIE
jgi:hypothetical protein